MKYASIDIGTNSVRLLKTEYQNHKFFNSSKAMQMTRIGKDVNETKLLNYDRMVETTMAIEHFVNEAMLYGAAEVVIMATSAVRDAENADVFLKMVYDKIGYEIDVISGEREAEVGFKGVLLGSKNPDSMKLVVDIGGGSTELIIGNMNGILFSKSLNIGAVRLTGAYITIDPVEETEYQSMKIAIESQLESVRADLERFNIDEVIGIGGTATTFATMQHKVAMYTREKVHGLKVSRVEIQNMNSILKSLSNNERKKIIGLEPKRADIIFAGGVILECLLSQHEIEKISVSDYDNLEGYLDYEIDLKK